MTSHLDIWRTGGIRVAQALISWCPVICVIQTFDPYGDRPLINTEAA